MIETRELTSGRIALVRAEKTVAIVVVIDKRARGEVLRFLGDRELRQLIDEYRRLKLVPDKQ